MDFVIFGVGLGATLVLFGWLWRTVGPQLRYRAGRDAVLSGEAMVNRISWRRFCRSGGALWVMGGFLLVLAAYVSLLLGLSDHTGALVVLITALVVFVIIALWLVVYLRRFGLSGLVPKREPAVVPATAPRGRARPGAATRLPSDAPATPDVGAPLPVQGPPLPTHGPAIPAGIAASLAPAAATGTETGANGSGEQGTPGTEGAHDVASAEPTASAEVAEQPEPDASVRDDQQADGADPAPTIIGAADRMEQAAATPHGAAEPQRSEDLNTRDPHHDETRVPDNGVANRARANNRTATTTEAQPRHVGTESFRAAIARQKANLDRAAARGRAAVSGPDTDPARQTDAGPREPVGREGSDWVRGDGTRDVPAGFPIKGNARSRRYHPAGTPSYEATIAEFYFATPAAAEAAGYRLPRALQGPAEEHVASEPEHYP